MRTHLRALPLALSMLLGACSGLPSQTPPPPTPIKPVPAGLTVSTPTAALEAPGTPVVTADVWDRLRSSFAMADCDADPEIMNWARQYTRNPQRFESQMEAVLPRLVYVQQIADRYNVAGEFVLVPWVESHFQPIPARKRQPAGMWQIMPATAGAMGLRVDGHYDGRLDVPAAAHAVMKLLEQYHQQFGDWRVADYAYNAGEFNVRKLIQKHGMPAEHPAIPTWPVRKVTREHLTKLLAIACVVREPQRFNVSLPALPDEDHLVKAELPQSMPIAQAADHAGMSVDALKQLNGAFGSDVADRKASSYLILPAQHAQQFRDAMLEQPGKMFADNQSASLANDTSARPAPAAKARPKKNHIVKAGESLWQIARRYAVNVTQLQRWNHLSGSTLKPGQVLKVSATH